MYRHGVRIKFTSVFPDFNRCSYLNIGTASLPSDKASNVLIFGINAKKLKFIVIARQHTVLLTQSKGKIAIMAKHGYYNILIVANYKHNF